MTTQNSDEEIGAEALKNGQNNGGGGEEAAATALNDGETTAGEVEGSKAKELKEKEGEEEKAVDNGDESVEDDRAFGTKTPPASQQRQTPPLSASIRAPTVRKRCSAVFGARTSHTSTSGGGGGGLSALTSAMLGKKPRKQSVLDNAQSGWRSFVQEEQLEQEMESHMRSKDAYLDKQDFLLRADYSQFERERDLRAQERRVQQQQQANSGSKPR
ncbi:hypothetical protein niasHS_001437 [Heterodera schachtii]|uniref:Craniofacial development protein 1 n=1 Tax=Heterodera schachtii TaxID=97005 RepID=A0ABD2KDS3_HETSC